MKTIKFRAWETRGRENGFMNYDPFLTNSFGKLSGSDSSTILMQFTGLLDKTGKMIFEGDVVKYGKTHNYEIGYFTEYGLFGMMDEENGKIIPLGHWGSSTRYSPYILSSYHTRRMEVVGNVHANPELLTSKL